MIVWKHCLSIAHSLQSDAATNIKVYVLIQKLNYIDIIYDTSMSIKSKNLLLPLIVAVRLQLYRIANSPNTFPGGRTLKKFPSRETSTLPSEMIETLSINEWLIIMKWNELILRHIIYLTENILEIYDFQYYKWMY